MFKQDAFAAVALILVLSAPLGAQDPLGDVVRAALEGNLGLRAERLAAERSGAAVAEARGAFLPRVSVDARYSRTSGVLDLGDFVNPAYRALNQLTGSTQFPTDIDARLPLAQETKLRVTQVLFSPEAGAALRARRGQRDGQDAALGVAARRLAADAQNAYLAHAGAVRVVEIYRSTLALVEENLRVSERLLANGSATPEIVLRARAERSEVQQRLAEAEQHRAAAARYLNLLLDRPLETPVSPPAEGELVFPAAPALEAALAGARVGREELRQGDAGVRTAEAGRRLARAAALPSVALSVDYGIQGNRYSLTGEDDFTVASVVFSWGAWSGQDGARRQQAALEAERARTRRTQLERQVELEVRQAHLSESVARAAIGTAEDRVAAARSTYRLVARRYEAGAAPQIELVDARAALTSAELNLVLTRYDHAARWVELERAAALRELPGTAGMRDEG